MLSPYCFASVCALFRSFRATVGSVSGGGLARSDWRPPDLTAASGASGAFRLLSQQDTTPIQSVDASPFRLLDPWGEGGGGSSSSSSAAFEAVLAAPSPFEGFGPSTRPAAEDGGEEVELVSVSSGVRQEEKVGFEGVIKSAYPCRPDIKPSYGLMCGFPLNCHRAPIIIMSAGSSY